jgi:hypothetical protein
VCERVQEMGVLVVMELGIGYCYDCTMIMILENLLNICRTRHHTCEPFVQGVV